MYGAELVAVKKPKPVQTVKERQLMDQIQRIRKSYNRFDRHGGYREACAELATETGGDVESIYSDWEHFASTSMYDGTIEVEDAEIAALQMVQSIYRRAS